MEDTSNDKKMDISSEEDSEISSEDSEISSEKMDTAQEDDGVGANCKEGKAMGISDEHFKKIATILKMDMPELKEWFVKSKYEAEEFRGIFNIVDNSKYGLNSINSIWKINLPERNEWFARFFENEPISDDDFSFYASISKMDVAELKERFVQSKYKAEEPRGFFKSSDRKIQHPLHVAAKKGEVEMVDMLIKEAKVDVNIQDKHGWTALHWAAYGNHGEMVYGLVMTCGADPDVRDLWDERTPLHVASRNGCAGAIEGFLRAECESRHRLNVNATDICGRTPLHIAAYHDKRALVAQALLKFPDIKLTIEDHSGSTALEVASRETNWKVFDVVRLKITPEVTDYNEPYYRDRQASVDAANAILVGAALIASVTFAAWLQPPLGYSTYYNEQYSNSLPAPPTSNPQYASFDHHPALQWFWAFNSLSFFMAIATVMSGAQSVLPSHRVTVKQEVAKLRRNLLITSTLLALSMVFVLLAFAIAGVIVVAPVFKLRASMYFTILIGGGVSIWFLCRLVWRIFCTALEMAGRLSPRECVDNVKLYYDLHMKT